MSAVEELGGVFTRGPLSSDDRVRIERLRACANAWGLDVVGLVPPGRERSLALTRIEEALMWAEKGIAMGHRVDGEKA